MHDKFGSADLLADITDDDLRRIREPLPPVASYVHNPWWEKFQYDLYNWDDPAWKRRNRGPGAWMPLLLTQGYFMAVRKAHAEVMTTYPDGKPKKFYAKVQRDERGEISAVYGARRGKEGEVSEVQAHREVLGIVEFGLGGDIDHTNGEGLDNRYDESNPKCNNLIYCGNRSENSHNTTRARHVHFGLPCGVEKKKNGRFGGIRCVRIKKRGKGSVRVIRSEEDWDTPKPAAQWYLDQLSKLHKKRQTWVHNPKSVSYINLPPLKIKKAQKRRMSVVRSSQPEQDIPF